MSGLGEPNSPRQFKKEVILPSTEVRSPFHINLPGNDAKPIDNLVSFFKYWKYFVKSLIHYFQDIALVKQFEANLSYQLISSVQFPGFKDLPVKIARELSLQQSQSLSLPPGQNQQASGVIDSISASTSPKQRPPLLPASSTFSGSSAQSNPDQKLADTAPVNASTNALQSVQSTSQTGSNGGATNTLADPNAAKRPNLFKTKSSSNTSFLKSASTTMGNLHKRNASSVGLQTQLATGQSALTGIPANFAADVKIPPNFFPQDSLFSSCAPIMLNHHQHTYQINQKIHRDLTQKLVPRLQGMLRNLLSKIKEIKSSLKNESFSHIDIAKEVSETGQVLYQYMNAVESYSNARPVLKKRTLDLADEDTATLDDPFLLKLRVDYQVKRQLLHESYMFASWINLQSISKELFAYILKELHVVLDKFGKLEFNPEMYQVLKTAVSNSSTKDWEHFILMNPNFLNTYASSPLSVKREVRHSDSIVLPYAHSVHNKCLRLGVLYKKSKLLKNYTRYFYLLTCNYMHEFRIEADETTGESKGNSKTKNPGLQVRKFSKDKIGGFVGPDDVPTKSYNLNDLFIKVKDENNFKFEIGRSSSGSKKATFKCLNQDDWLGWYGDLHQLCEFGNKHIERFAFVQNRIDVKESQENKHPVVTPEAKPAADSTPKTVTLPALSGALPSSRKAAMQSSGASLSVQDALAQARSNSNTPLSGMFTPNIRTPGDENGNPFETTFFSGLDQNGSTKYNTSSSLIPSTTSSDSAIPLVPSSPGPTVPAATTSSVAVNHEKEHESYLKMQQEILRRQQQDLRKLQDAPVSTAKAINLLQPPGLRRKSSSDSVHSVQSFEVASSGLDALVDVGNNLITQAMDTVANQLVEGNGAPGKASEPAPDVYVSRH